MKDFRWKNFKRYLKKFLVVPLFRRRVQEFPVLAAPSVIMKFLKAGTTERIFSETRYRIPEKKGRRVKIPLSWNFVIPIEKFQFQAWREKEFFLNFWLSRKLKKRNVTWEFFFRQNVRNDMKRFIVRKLKPTVSNWKLRNGRTRSFRNEFMKRDQKTRIEKLGVIENLERIKILNGFNWWRWGIWIFIDSSRHLNIRMGKQVNFSFYLNFSKVLGK